MPKPPMTDRQLGECNLDGNPLPQFSAPNAPPEETMAAPLLQQVGRPRAATRQVMLLLGLDFVLSQAIEETLDRAQEHRDLRCSLDMLGEGARTAGDAERYFPSYSNAIQAIAASAGKNALPDRPGISVK